MKFIWISLMFLVACSKEQMPSKTTAHFKGEVFVLRKADTTFFRVSPGELLQDTDVIYFKSPDVKEFNLSNIESEKYFSSEYRVDLSSSCVVGNQKIEGMSRVYTNQFPLREALPPAAYLQAVKENSEEAIKDLVCNIQIALTYNSKSDSYSLSKRNIKLTSRNRDFFGNQKNESIQIENFKNTLLYPNPSIVKSQLFCSQFATQLEIRPGAEVSMMDLVYSSYISKSTSSGHKDPRKEKARQFCLIKMIDDYGLSEISKEFELVFSGYEPEIFFRTHQRRSNDRWTVYQFEMWNPHEVPTMVVIKRSELMAWMDNSKREDRKVNLAIGFSGDTELIGDSYPDRKIVNGRSGFAFVILQPGQKISGVAWVGHNLSFANADSNLGTPFYSLKKHYSLYENINQITTNDFSRKIPLKEFRTP